MVASLDSRLRFVEVSDERTEKCAQGGDCEKTFAEHVEVVMRLLVELMGIEEYLSSMHDDTGGSGYLGKPGRRARFDRNANVTM